MIEIRQLLNNKKDEALLFAKKVYIESKDESYSEQGIETFCNFVNNKKITKFFFEISVRFFKNINLISINYLVNYYL